MKTNKFYSFADNHGFTYRILSPDTVELFSLDAVGLLVGSYYDEDENMVLPDKIEVKIGDFEKKFKVVSIADQAFQNDREDYTFDTLGGATKVTIPDTVTSIGDVAFCDCHELAEVVLPKNLKDIGSSCFAGCSSLSSIILPDSLDVIWYETFNGCSSLSSVILPASLKVIAFDAFIGCSSLSSIFLPDSLEEIGEEVFKDCDSLESIIVPKGSLEKFRALFGDDPVAKLLVEA